MSKTTRSLQPTSNFQLPTSNFQLPTSNFQPSTFAFRPSVFPFAKIRVRSRLKSSHLTPPTPAGLCGQVANSSGPSLSSQFSPFPSPTLDVLRSKFSVPFPKHRAKGHRNTARHCRNRNNTLPPFQLAEIGVHSRLIHHPPFLSSTHKPFIS